MAHIKVMSNGGCFGRFGFNSDDPNGEAAARKAAAGVVEMHKNHKGDKTGSSPSSSANYTIEYDEGEYPLKG